MRTGTCIGVVLAGGLARRMGGGDKALRKAGGISLLAHAIAALRPQCQGLVLSANGDPARFAGFDVPVVADGEPGFMGPLAGILAGLDWVAAHCPDVSLAISVPADTPFLPGDLAARLMDARAIDNAAIACACSGGRTHPAIAVWPVSIRNDLRHALVVEDMRKVEAFSQNYRRAVVEWPTEPYDPFFNANDPSDLAAAETILSRRDKHIVSARRFCEIASLAAQEETRSLFMAGPEVENVQIDELKKGLADGSILLVDVREPNEYAAGRIPGAILNPLQRFDPAALPSAPGKRVVLSCRSGKRSLTALALARDAGRADVRAHYPGGFQEWANAGENVEL